MAQVASISMAWQALMGVAVTSAAVLNSTLTTVQDGVDTLAVHARELKEKTESNSEKDLAMFEDTSIIQRNIMLAATIQSAADYRNKSAAHAASYDQAAILLQTRISERRARLQATATA